ncbi:MAG TPA: penicillin acylase family protein [Candidatus Thermoplasmatota archaeon]|nr:penicillin acylase family protein [Candidatus Thermoplasmatota archaeon]
MAGPRRAAIATVLLLSLLAGCFDGKGADPSGQATHVTPSFTAFPSSPPTSPGDPCAPAGAGVGIATGDHAPAHARSEVPVESRLPVPRGGAPTQAVIRTDGYGVPHIYADDEYTLFYANGYVQARDRLFQLDVLRHVGYGDSAVIAGAGQLASDMAVRRDLYSPAEIHAQFDGAEPAIKEALQAYADGVNRFIAEAGARDSLPAEFLALGRVPEPWTPYDSVASIDYLIGYFGVGGGQELEHAQKLTALTGSLGSLEAAHAAFADLSWATVDDAYTSIAAADKQVQGCESVPAFAEVPAEQLAEALSSMGAVPFGVPAEVPLPLQFGLGGRQGYGLMEGFKWGSNALLIAGEHTATGKPMMFGGPQMGYYKPPVPYQIGLHGAGYDAVGIGVTSAPGIVIGRTPTFAWSITSGADDQVDTLVVRLDPADDHHYLWDGVSEAMECRREIHRALPNAAAPTDPPRLHAQEICRVRGMPVIAWDPAAGLAWAQKTTTRGKEVAGAWMWLGLARQTDLEGFLGQLAAFPFTFNFHYAGPEGIAYVHTGDVPLRDPGLDPRFPALAGSAHGWRGEAVGLGLQTSIINPSTGYVANWNNAPAKGWRTGDGLQNWGSVHRVQLLDHFVAQRLAEGRPIAWQDVADILEAAATHDPFARQSAPLLAKATRDSGDASLLPLAEALESWAAADYPWRDDDGDGKYDDAGHGVWDAARLALQRRVFADELGETTPAIVLDPAASSDPHAGDHGRHDNKESTLVDALNGRTEHPWCDHIGTGGVETCRDQLVGSLRDALAALGKDTAAWRIPIHESRFTPIGGAHADRIPMVNRGSWNQVVAIGQGLDQAQGVLPPGNSALYTPLELLMVQAGADVEPASLTAELGLYTSFVYKPLPVTADEVDSVAVSTMTLDVVR